MSGRLVLAVDGGNSKTDVALVDGEGRVLGAARGPGFSYVRDGVPTCIDGLAATIAFICTEAGLARSPLPLAEIAVYCLPGADYRANRRRLAQAVAERGWAVRDVVRNDTFALLRLGTQRRWGIAVVCGAGINCLGIAPNGRIARFPALDWVSGDWGGGFSVGREALAAAVRGRDGRGPGTSLERLVPEHFGLSRPQAVVAAIHSGRLDKRRVVELPPVVFAAAGGGDRAAMAILDRLADEVVAMAATAIRRLRLVRSDVEVVLGGGLFQNDDAAFVDRIHQGIARVAPRSRISLVVAPPVVGAALLGLDELGAGSEAGRRFRASLTHERIRPVTP